MPQRVELEWTVRLAGHAVPVEEPGPGRDDETAERKPEPTGAGGCHEARPPLQLDGDGGDDEHDESGLARLGHDERERRGYEPLAKTPFVTGTKTRPPETSG